MDSEAARALRSLPLFQGLSESFLEILAGRTVVRTLPDKAFLFREGEPANGLYIILRGRIEVYRSTAEGREQVIHIEKRNRHLGELPLLDGTPYPATARAVGETRIAFMPRDAFQWAYHEYPEIADSIIRDLGGRLRKLVGLVEKLSLKEVPARVATAVLEAAVTASRARDGASFHLPTTQDEMAAQLGTTRESVSRAMARLGEQGAISHKGSRITIKNLAALEKASGGTVEALTGSLFDRMLPTLELPGAPPSGSGEGEGGAQ